jgi:hypothetical protein
MGHAPTDAPNQTDGISREREGVGNWVGAGERLDHDRLGWRHELITKWKCSFVKTTI